MAMDHEKLRTVLEQISMRLHDDGLPVGASVEEQQRHLWQQLLNTESKLQSATAELQTLRSQQAKEMEEVESYVAHIRGLLEERECLTADYEKDNEHLRQELHQIRQQQESQSKELEEMLAQEDLGEIGLSTPSEQVAYLLVERATLLERLEAAERTLESQSITVSLREDKDQEPISHTKVEELRRRGEDLQKTIDNVPKSSSQSPLKKLFGLRRSGQRKHNLTPARSEELSQEKNERQWLERDLEEASRRLAMAHQDIRRLTNELDAAKNNNLDSSAMMKLQRVKEQNERLDAENRALSERVHTLEAEKKNLLVQVPINDTDQNSAIVDQKSKTVSGNLQKNLSAHDDDYIHKRCHEAMEDGLVQVRELQRQLQRLRKDQEELEERNEELEALLGEAQNASKEDKHHHEAELEGLHRRIKGLEAELKKQDVQEKNLSNREEHKHPESYLQLHLRESSQERLSLLEARLTEEKDWRKQLEADLSAAQAALRKDKEALQIGERELKKLRLEVKSLQTECQQGKTLIKSLTQVKAEKAALEEKVKRLEHTQKELQSELDQCHDLKEDKDKRKETHDRISDEFSSLQIAHDTLRSELVSERQQNTELQVKLHSCFQENLMAEGKIKGLEHEMQSLEEQLKWHQEQHSAKETFSSCQVPEELSPSPEKNMDELHTRLLYLKLELDRMQAKLAEEREEASQEKLALQAQASEAQKFQSLLVSAERELRYVKETNMDLKRHNTLLEQENLKFSAELKQAQTKRMQAEEIVQHRVTECEHQQQKIRELEVEVACNSTNQSVISGLQEDLQAERARLTAADKKVLELQQQLSSAQLQLHVQEVQAEKITNLERDNMELSDTFSALRAKQQEEQITRNLLEKNVEELRQQVQSLRLNEATMTRTNATVSQLAKQLEFSLTNVQAECKKTREEVKDSEETNHKLQETLMAIQLERERLQRKYYKKQIQYKTKLRQAKQIFRKMIDQRNDTILKLVEDVNKTAHTMTKDKEILLEERRKVLEKISKVEEIDVRAASTVQHRFNTLEAERRKLEYQIEMLSSQVSSIKSALRNVQENTKKSGRLYQGNADISSPCPWSYLDNLDICHVAVGSTQPSVSSPQPSEQAYLNLTSPLVPLDTQIGGKSYNISTSQHPIHMK